MLEKPHRAAREKMERRATRVVVGAGPRPAAAGAGSEREAAARPRGASGSMRCLPGWHGPGCGVPTVVQYSNLPTKERLVPREVPRRVINAININHEFGLLDVRFHELGGVVGISWCASPTSPRTREPLTSSSAEC